MKKYSIITLVLALCACMFAGCRNRNYVEPTSASTTNTRPTTEATTQAATQETTQATTQETTQQTEARNEDHTSEGTDHEGSGITDEILPENGGIEGRMRRNVPGKP